MNWTLAIEKNQIALLRLVAGLLVMVEMWGGESKTVLPRHVRSWVMRQARCVQSAALRLIVIKARGLVVKLRPKRSAPTGLKKKPRSERKMTFPLFDKRKQVGKGRGVKYAKHAPRISMFGWSEPEFEPEAPVPSPDDLVDAAGLKRRLEMLKTALEDIPKQARRLARWQARQAENNARPKSPMRPGRPPGFRQRATHEADEILTECHRLALWSMIEADRASRDQRSMPAPDT